MFNGNRITFAKSYIKKQITNKFPTQLELELNPYLSLEELKQVAHKNGL